MAFPRWIGRVLRWQIGALAGVFAAVAVFDAVVMPYRFWDSLAFGAWSRSIAEGQGLWVGAPALFLQRPLFYIVQGLTWRATGDHAWLARLISLLFAVILALATWLLARQLTRADEGRALLPPLALGVLLSCSVFATYEAAGMSDVPVAALVAATAAAVWRVRRGRWWDALIVVCAAGAVLAKPSALLGFAGLVPALLVLQGRRATRGLAALFVGIAAALAYDAWQARRISTGLVSLLTAGNDRFWQDRGAAARWDALARAEWLGAGLRLLVLYGLAHAIVRVLGGPPRAALATAATVAISWSLAGPLIADGSTGYPFTSTAIGALAWLLLAGAMVAAPFLSQDDSLDRRTYGALLLWLAPTALAWAWQRADEVRLLAPAWAPLVLLTAAALASLTLALARFRPAAALMPAAALAALVLSNLISIDGLGYRGWRELLDLGPSGWSSRAAMENYAYGPFSYELDLARENVGDSGTIVSSNGRLAYFFPGRVNIEYARTCGELKGARFFSFLTSGESLEFAREAGQPLDPLSWMQCTNPRVELLGEQPGIYAAFVVGRPPRRPSTPADCHITTTPGERMDAVFGSDLSYSAAKVLRDRALAVGFQGTALEQTTCSRFRVVVTGIPDSRAVEADFRREAASVGLSVKYVPAVRYPAVGDVAAVR
jgi:4-amino-4-deoxy-L-arabinose transferase-like glycosyltransferase